VRAARRRVGSVRLHGDDDDRGCDDDDRGCDASRATTANFANERKVDHDDDQVCSLDGDGYPWTTLDRRERCRSTGMRPTTR
jgi:hypothetical protein